MNSRQKLTVLHIGAARYRREDRGHVTYGIWRELASGFRRYEVIARSQDKAAQWSDGNLRVTLISSHMDREVEFLVTQFKALPQALRIKPDVIVCQSPVLGGLAAIVAADMIGAKTLIEMHGMEFFVPARFGSRLWIIQQLTRFAIKRADMIRVLSPRMGEQLARMYGADLAGRTKVLPPRVDTSHFIRKTRYRDAGDALRLVMVAAVNDNKGQLRLISALARSQLPLELHIVGEGPDLENVRRKAETLLREDANLRVVVHGALPHAAVAGVLHQCDVFIFYSIIESAGRAMMEAMAVGLPVVITNAGFCVDFVKHGEEGFVLGPDPDSEIVGVLERFNADRALAQRMGAAARERAIRDFDSVRLFEEYRQLIAETARR